MGNKMFPKNVESHISLERQKKFHVASHWNKHILHEQFLQQETCMNLVSGEGLGEQTWLVTIALNMLKLFSTESDY